MLRTSKISSISSALIFLLLILPGTGSSYTDKAIKTAAEIRHEATLASTGSAGYPLPLAAHWNTGEQFPRYAGWTPDYQLGLIESGHHILPSFHHPSSRKTEWQTESKYKSYYATAMGKCKDLGLPICFVGSQWERTLSEDSYYKGLPAATNPNCVKPDGVVLAKVSPFGQPSHWETVGTEWTNNTIIIAAQAQYPNPPRVIWLSNNEHPKLRWGNAETDDSKFLGLYGTGKTEAFKKEIIGNGFVNLYGALIKGLKSKLTTDWAGVSKCIGYEANQDRSFGRWAGWKDYSYEKTNRISPWPFVWDGTSPSYYSDNWSSITDYQVFSAQVEAMNWVFQKVEALSNNADYIFEMSVWDGASGTENDKRDYYESLGQTYNPIRYKGWVQYGMWIMRPRVVREFRGYIETLDNHGAYWLELVDAVDAVWENSTLKRFWRFGTLVENGTYAHPYQISIPTEYQSTPRNYFLTTNLDPARPWGLYSRINVFSMALVIGTAPDREWLVYLHSPLKEYSDVKVTIPGYKQISVNSSPGGFFYHILENTGKVTAVQLDAVPPEPPKNLGISIISDK